MIGMYFKIAFRNLRRNKVYSFINIGGLALGIAAFLLILEYVSFEKSYNRFHKNTAGIYRLLNQGIKGDTWGQIEPGWAPKAKQNFPEIKDFCRFEDGVAQGIVRRDGANSEPFREKNIGYAEGNFFSFFSFPLISGNAEIFNRPNVVFISSASAKKYFGKENPTGKSLTLFNQFGTTRYTVEGIFEIPANSDIQYDMVFSLETLKNPANLNNNNWAELTNIGSQYINTCFLVAPGTDHKKLEQKLTDLRTKFSKENDGVVFRLQSLENVHLATSLDDTYQTTGNLKYVYILSVVAFLILLIAWFNYVNLSTANALKRANEVGVRKIVGASQGSLVLQFLSESILVNILAFSFALLLVYFLQPFFNTVMGKNVSLVSITYSSAWMIGLGLLILGTLITGIYTAYILADFNPVETLKNKISKTSRGSFLRKTLVVSQFSISIALILATILIFQQLKYMQNSNLGINAEQLMVIRGPEIGNDSTYSSRKDAFLNSIAQQSYVQDYAVSGSIPGNFYNFITSGFTQPGSKSGDELKPYSFAIIGDRYLNTYQIKLKAGRNFTSAECSVDWDDNSKVLLNERAVAELGFKSPEEAIRTKIQWDERALEVIGVVTDYHHTGLQKAIDPIIFYPQNSSSYLTIRLSSDNLQTNIAKLATLYKDNFVGNPFEYFFVDENFNKQYATEQQYSRMFTAASIWAIVIACLGLFGLTTFIVESRTKEIGIRKVLGASVANITRLLSKDFLMLVLIAAFIAFPIAWLVMTKWLQDFAYRIDIGWWVFVIAGGIAVLIAFVTIGFQAVKAAMSNPIKNLRTE